MSLRRARFLLDMLPASHCFGVPYLTVALVDQCQMSSVIIASSNTETLLSGRSPLSSSCLYHDNTTLGFTNGSSVMESVILA